MSGEVHSIRLRGPWILRIEPAPTADAGGRSRPATSLPFHWPPRWSDVAPGRRQKATLLRSFQKPFNLREERVFVAVESDGGGGQLRLNGQPLGTLQSSLCRFDVTSLLKLRNELMLEVEAGRDELDEVRLEISNRHRRADGQ